MGYQNIIYIKSQSNQRLKQLVRLRNRTHRDKAGVLLIEGYREILRAVNSGIKIEELYFCESLFLKGNEPDLIHRTYEVGARLFALSKKSFSKISYRDRPDGLIATAAQIRLGLSSLKLTLNPLIIVAQSIEKPGNLGSIIRSVDAAGADGIIVCDHKTDINNPNVVRASTGTLFTVQVVEATTHKAFQWLTRHKIQILAATPQAKTLYSEVDLTKPLAIAVGAEQYGLRHDFIEKADIKAFIPMAGVADSLNVATATAVILFEAARQRGFPMKK